MLRLSLLQASQAQRIRKDIDAFTHRVQQHKTAFASHVLYKYSTGYTAAYPMLDAAAADLAKLSKECAHQTELASVFELTSAVAPVTEAIKELYEQLVAVKDVWDCCMLCDIQFQVCSLQGHSARCSPTCHHSTATGSQRPPAAPSASIMQCRVLWQQRSVAGTIATHVAHACTSCVLCQPSFVVS